MGKFKVGDKVRITKGYWADHVGIIVEAVEENYVSGIEASYLIRTDEKPFGMNYQESLLEIVEDSDPTDIFEKSLHDGRAEEPFFEMAGRIPEDIKVDVKGKHILIVAVGNNESRGVKHFHVFRSIKDLNAWKDGACLMFEKNQYFDHKHNSETLTKDELEALVSKLKEVPKDNYPGKTYWEYLIYLWNAGNIDWVIPLTAPMPVYDYNTITRYKKD